MPVLQMHSTFQCGGESFHDCLGADTKDNDVEELHSHKKLNVNELEDIVRSKEECDGDIKLFFIVLK